MKPVTIRTVITRYNENLEWIKGFKNVIIYNKGLSINHNNFAYHTIIIEQENIGREQYCIYKHIVDNYDNLDEYTLFLQGYPFDHSPNLYDDLLLIENELNNDNHFDFMYVSSNMHISNVLSDTLVGNVDPKFKNYSPLYEKIFGKSLQGVKAKYVSFGAGSQFIVSKKAILTHEKSFYQNIVDILGYCQSPSEGHVLERLGHEIFIETGINQTAYS